MTTSSPSNSSQALKMPVWCQILDDVIARALKERKKKEASP